MQITFAEYQSMLWSKLVEMGFVTLDTERDRHDKVIARMGRSYTVTFSELL